MVAGLSATSSAAVANAPFIVLAPPPTAYLVWVAGWLVAMLGLAVRSFARCEL
jgi:hypothetical protein